MGKGAPPSTTLAHTRKMVTEFLNESDLFDELCRLRTYVWTEEPSDCALFELAELAADHGVNDALALDRFLQEVA